jgi:hypothetical protein
MKRFEFPITLAGYGEDADHAWIDACENFNNDWGATPDEFTVENDEPEETKMLDDDEVREAIRNIVHKYDVELVSILRNIQMSVDVTLDENIYYKEQEKMENEIRAIKGVAINDINYRDIE